MDKFNLFKDDKILSISTKFRVRPDKNRFIVYLHDIQKLGSYKLLPPIDGTLLTLFNGKNKLSEIIHKISYLFEIEVFKAKEIVEYLIKNYEMIFDERFLIPVDENNSISYLDYSMLNFMQKVDFSEKFCETINNKKLQTPLSMICLPSNLCQVDCAYCYAERRTVGLDEHLTISDWTRIINESHEIGIDMLVFSGGDPLTYRAIEAVLEQLPKKGIKFLLPTKTYIDKKYATRLSSLGISEYATFQISIDGYSSNIDEILNTKNYPKRAFETITNLIEAGFDVQTNSVAMPLNFTEIPTLILKLHQLGVKTINITNYSRTIYRHKDELFLSLEQIAWLSDEVSNLKEVLKMNNLHYSGTELDYSKMTVEKKAAIWQQRAMCSGGISALVITPDGKVTLCEQAPQKPPFIIGDLKKQSIMEIWNSDEIDSFIHPKQDKFAGTVCFDCNDFNDCHKKYGRCFRDAISTYDSLYSPSPNCPRAPPGLRMS